MTAIQYKGYTARIQYSDEDACFVGHLDGIRDIVGFDGASMAEAEAAFHEAVDDYLSACKKLGSDPNKPAFS